MEQTKLLERLKQLSYDELVTEVSLLNITKKQLTQLVIMAGGYVTTSDTKEALKQRLITAINVERTHKGILGSAKP